MKQPTVFIASSSISLAVAQQVQLELERHSVSTIIWVENNFIGKTGIAYLTEIADEVDFAIFILTLDDSLLKRSRQALSAREKLYFELGFFAGKLGLERTFILAEDSAKQILPIDMEAVTYITFSRQDDDLRVASTHAISIIRSLTKKLIMREPSSLEYYSCFISYSRQDNTFATKLHDDLQQLGIRSWLDAKNMQPGDNIQDQIYRAIQVHDKLIVVLSKASVKSTWVITELKKGLDLEATRHQTVLFPVSLDNAIFTTQTPDEISQLKQRQIADFSNWQNSDSYNQAFSKLVKNLAINASIESRGR